MGSLTRGKMKLLDLLFSLIFGGFYILGWVLIVVGLANDTWIRFNADRTEPDDKKADNAYECKAGLWVACCPLDKWVLKNDTNIDNFDDQRECRQIVVDTTPYEHFLDKTDVEKVELWAIRGFML